MNDLQIAILWVHLWSAVLFIGGSFFMWLVLMPVSRELAPDESARTVLVGRVARAFARWSNATLLLLVATGLYNATWYLPSADLATDLGTVAGQLLLVKVVLVGVLIALIYLHGLYYGRIISRLARERRVDELAQVRKRSRLVSYANLGLMAAILVVVTLMQGWA